MATKRKDAPEEPRKDASGRELFPWEVDPADQVGRRQTADAEPDDSAPTGAATQMGTEGGQ